MPAQKTVLITGCSPGGIGHALALEFHAQGCRVFATGRNVDKLADLQAKGIETFALDVTSDASVKAAVAKVGELTGGTLDILFNNAGQAYYAAATDVDIDEVRGVFETNLFGVMRMVRHFAPLLVAAKGKIVNVGSVSGIIPYAFGSPYNATKAALHSYGDTLRVEMAPFGVTHALSLVLGGVLGPKYASGQQNHSWNPRKRSPTVVADYGALNYHSGKFSPSRITDAELSVLRVHVDVITVVTGGVTSNVSENAVSRGKEVPEGSLYEPIADVISRKRMNRSRAGAMPTAVYARKVVATVLRRSPTWYWLGELTLSTWFIATFLPRKTFDFFISRAVGLNELTKLLRQRQKAQ